MISDRQDYSTTGTRMRGTLLAGAIGASPEGSRHAARAAHCTPLAKRMPSLQQDQGAGRGAGPPWIDGLQPGNEKSSPEYGEHGRGGEPTDACASTVSPTSRKNQNGLPVVACTVTGGRARRRPVGRRSDEERDSGGKQGRPREGPAKYSVLSTRGEAAKIGWRRNATSKRAATNARWPSSAS